MAKKFVWCWLFHLHFSKEIKRGNATSVQVIVDGANSNAAATVLGYINTMYNNTL